MTINFTQNGIQYALVIAPKGLRESEIRLEDIKPDKELWTSKQKAEMESGRKGREAAARTKR